VISFVDHYRSRTNISVHVTRRSIRVLARRSKGETLPRAGSRSDRDTGPRKVARLSSNSLDGAGKSLPAQARRQQFGRRTSLVAFGGASGQPVSFDRASSIGCIHTAVRASYIGLCAATCVHVDRRERRYRAQQGGRRPLAVAHTRADWMGHRRPSAQLLNEEPRLLVPYPIGYGIRTNAAARPFRIIEPCARHQRANLQRSRREARECQLLSASWTAIQQGEGGEGERGDRGRFSGFGKTRPSSAGNGRTLR